MENCSLNKVIRNLYDNKVTFIRNKNIELERAYFTRSHNIPMGEIMQGSSFEDHFASYKEMVKKGNEDEISLIFTLLQEYFLFSYGHDMMFKKKLEADIFTSIPIENLIYPKLKSTIKENYNDLSVMKENPNFESNMEEIDKIVYTFLELQSLLYLLYCNEFQFPNGWQKICPDTFEDILDILNKSKMTIGDFLHSLIDFKCQIMTEILDEIGNSELRKEYLKKVEELQENQHKKTKTFAHINLPITYYLEHTFLDFLDSELKSSLLDDNNPNHSKKILVPKN